jgi:hypothetical protein
VSLSVRWLYCTCTPVHLTYACLARQLRVVVIASSCIALWRLSSCCYEATPLGHTTGDGSYVKGREVHTVVHTVVPEVHTGTTTYM